MQTVPLNGVVDCVVRNAHNKLLEKPQELRTMKASARKKEFAKYIEETRRQMTGLLALVRWQEKRVHVTRQCEDLIKSLDFSAWHTMHTAEQLSMSAEAFSHQLRTPMYDVRTSVDVLSSGTYPSLPSLNTHNILPPEKLSAVVEDSSDLTEQLEFILRAQLLKCKVPPEFSTVKVSNGKLKLICDDEFELTLSVQLEHALRPWKVVRVLFLARAQGGEYPTTDWIDRILEKRMLDAKEPLEEARRFLGDCARHLTWQILSAQAIACLPSSTVQADLINGVLTLLYWQDAPLLNFDPLMSPALRKHHGSAAAGPSRGAGAQIILHSTRDRSAAGSTYLTPVEFDHVPKILDDKGRLFTLTVTRRALSVEALLAAARTAHSRCRLRLLLHTLNAAPLPAVPGPSAAGGGRQQQVSLALAADDLELHVQCGAARRLAVSVDPRSGLFLVRDLDTAAAAPGTLRTLEAALNRVSPDGSLEGAAEGVGSWVRGEALRRILGAAPALGVRGTMTLHGYTHTQAAQLAAGGNSPRLFLIPPGTMLLDPEPEPHLPASAPPAQAGRGGAAAAAAAGAKPGAASGAAGVARPAAAQDVATLVVELQCPCDKSDKTGYGGSDVVKEGKEAGAEAGERSLLACSLLAVAVGKTAPRFSQPFHPRPPPHGPADVAAAAGGLPLKRPREADGDGLAGGGGWGPEVSEAVEWGTRAMRRLRMRRELQSLALHFRSVGAAADSDEALIVRVPLRPPAGGPAATRAGEGAVREVRLRLVDTPPAGTSGAAAGRGASVHEGCGGRLVTGSGLSWQWDLAVPRPATAAAAAAESGDGGDGIGSGDGEMRGLGHRVQGWLGRPGGGGGSLRRGRDGSAWVSEGEGAAELVATVAASESLHSLYSALAGSIKVEWPAAGAWDSMRLVMLSSAWPMMPVSDSAKGVPAGTPPAAAEVVIRALVSRHALLEVCMPESLEVLKGELETAINGAVEGWELGGSLRPQTRASGDILWAGQLTQAIRSLVALTPLLTALARARRPAAAPDWAVLGFARGGGGVALVYRGTFAVRLAATRPPRGWGGASLVSPTAAGGEEESRGGRGQGGLRVGIWDLCAGPGPVLPPAGAAGAMGSVGLHEALLGAAAGAPRRDDAPVGGAASGLFDSLHPLPAAAPLFLALKAPLPPRPPANKDKDAPAAAGGSASAAGADKGQDGAGGEGSIGRSKRSSEEARLRADGGRVALYCSPLEVWEVIERLGRHLEAWSALIHLRRHAAAPPLAALPALLAPLRPPAPAQPAGGGGAAAAADSAKDAAEGRAVINVAGERLRFCFEVLAPNDDPARADRLQLTVEGAAGGEDGVPEGDVATLRSLWGGIAAVARRGERAPYGAAVPAIVHLLSLPPRPLRAVCSLLRSLASPWDMPGPGPAGPGGPLVCEGGRMEHVQVALAWSGLLLAASPVALAASDPARPGAAAAGAAAGTAGGSAAGASVAAGGGGGASGGGGAMPGVWHEPSLNEVTYGYVAGKLSLGRRGGRAVQLLRRNAVSQSVYSKIVQLLSVAIDVPAAEGDQALAAAVNKKLLAPLRPLLVPAPSA